MAKTWIVESGHGTYSGAQRHLRNGETPCDPCAIARNIYMRDYRKARGEKGSKQEQVANNARARALWRLAKMYPEEFRRLTMEELYGESVA